MLEVNIPYLICLYSKKLHPVFPLSQPRSQGLFPYLGAGQERVRIFPPCPQDREKALGMRLPLALPRPIVKLNFNRVPAFLSAECEVSTAQKTGQIVSGYSIVLHMYFQVKHGNNRYFTITAEIHVRSLANFYSQYADRHMNLKFMRHVSEREPAIRQFVIVENKLMSVFNASVLLLIMNFVITSSK